MQAPLESLYTDLSVTYFWRCCMCSEVASETVVASNGSQILTPYRFPAGGWKAIDFYGVSRLICPKHQVEMAVDGEKLFPREEKSPSS